MFTKYHPLDIVQSDVVRNMYVVLTYLLCNGSILELGHREFVFYTKIMSTLKNMSIRNVVPFINVPVNIMHSYF